MISKKTVARMTIIAAAAAFAGTLAFAQPTFAQGPNPGGPMMGGERHPEIHHAIVAIKHAEDYLRAASHDFGGHRVDALNACEEAMKQLRICMKYDKH